MRLETTWDNGGTNINMEATKSFNVMAHSQIWLASNEEHFTIIMQVSFTLEIKINHLIRIVS